MLEQHIIQEFRPLPRAAKYMKVLCKIVDAINLQFETPLPSPRVPNLAIRPKNPFRSGIPRALGLARAWREALKNGLKSPAAPHRKSKPARGAEELADQAAGKAAAEKPKWGAEQVELGKLFASAVLHGGLADAYLLVALARYIDKSQQDILIINDRLAVELSVSWQGEQGSEHRYWYPDPLTATLIARWPKIIPNTPLTGDKEQPLSFKRSRMVRAS